MRTRSNNVILNGVKDLSQASRSHRFAYVIKEIVRVPRMARMTAREREGV
jgi:hypothetical protein